MVVSLIFIVSLFVLNFVSVELVENTIVIDKSVLNAFDHGWGLALPQQCYVCTHWFSDGCTKVALPPDHPVCPHD